MAFLQGNKGIRGNYNSPPMAGVLAYTSNVTITASGFPFTIDSTNVLIRSLTVQNVSGVVTNYENGERGISITASSNVITIAGAGTPFVSTDKYYISLDVLGVGLDQSQDVVKTLDMTVKKSSEVSLVDSTNLAAATTYYPSSSGLLLSQYDTINIMGVTSGGVTTTIEATLDPAVSPDFLDITKSCFDLVSGNQNNTSFIDTSFILDLKSLNVTAIRIKSVTSDNTNAVQYSYKFSK